VGRRIRSVATIWYGRVREDEYRLCHADGTVRFFAGRELVFARHPDGTVKRILGSALDITAREQAEEALRESESFYRQTLESIPGMVFTTRPDGYCDYQSQGWIHGVPTEHWRRLNKLQHPDDRAPLRRMALNRGRALTT
jgi:PAS domain-containing protein